MRSIAVMNQKGGVGKTTTVVNVSAALAEAGHRVCLVDLDPQAHATLHVGVEPHPDEPSIYDVLIRKTPVAEVRRQDVLPHAEGPVPVAGPEVGVAAAAGSQTQHPDPRAAAGPRTGSVTRRRKRPLRTGSEIGRVPLLACQAVLQPSGDQNTA